MRPRARAVGTERHEEDRDERRREADHGAGAEDPRRGAAVHGALAQQLGQVMVRLQQRLAGTAGDDGLCPVDDAEQQRREQERQRDRQPSFHTNNTRRVSAMYST